MDHQPFVARKKAKSNDKDLATLQQQEIEKTYTTSLRWHNPDQVIRVKKRDRFSLSQISAPLVVNIFAYYL